MNGSDLYVYDDYDDVEHVTFCYFILGTAFPLVWAFFFLSFSLQSTSSGYEIAGFGDNKVMCGYLEDWGLIVSGFLFTVALFYSFLIIYSIYVNREQDSFQLEAAMENPKYKKVVKFEENYWRIFIIFSILTLFATFSVIDQFYGNEILMSCGNLFKLAELFFYIIAGFFSLIAVFSIILFATDRKPRDSDVNRPNQQQFPRYAHPYNSLEDMF